MLELLIFLAIDINIDPEIGEIGPFSLTWHGLFSAVGIVGGVWLAVTLARKNGIPTDIGQEIALVGVPAAIIGARLFFVAEHWEDGGFSDDPARIITGLNEGGITLYGGLIAGALAGLVYGVIRGWPWGVGLDAAAPGMILGQGLGRIGDLINGEHLATESSLPWAVRYVHPSTLGELGVAVHPTAGGYELLGDFLILGVLVWAGWGLGRLGLWLRLPERLRSPWIRQPGWVFVLYMVLYSAMRFVLSEFRIDEQTIGDVPVPQVVSVIIIGLAFIAAGLLRRYPGPIPREYAERMWPEEDQRGGPTRSKASA